MNIILVEADFQREFSQDRLRETYQSSIRYKSAVGVDRVNTTIFESNLPDNIEIIHRKVSSNNYQFSQYREKLLSRGKNKLPRIIAVPTLRDKLTLKALSNILTSIYVPKTESLHSIIANIAEDYSSGRYNSVLHLDVENYYPSIRHELLLEELKKDIDKEEILSLIGNALKQNIVSKPEGKNRSFLSVGVPQGLSISNTLANVYMIPIDAKFSNAASYKYYRYVDDILILCNADEMEKIRKEVTEDCQGRGLKLHEVNAPDGKGTAGDISNGFIYLGYDFNPSRISVRKRSIDSLRESIIKIFTYYKYSKEKNLHHLKWTLDFRVTGCVFNDTRYGWLFFFSQINDESLLHSLDHFVNRLCARFKIDTNQTRLKKFARAYKEIKKNISNTKYIPNFDALSLGEKRRILLDVFGWKKPLVSDSEIQYQFNRIIYKNVKALEQDLARNS